MKPTRRYSNDLAVVNQGWNLNAERYLRNYDNPQKLLQTQIWAYSEQEDEDEEVQETTTWCSNCNEYTLEYVDKLDAYFCFKCTTKKTKEEYANQLVDPRSNICINEDTN